MRENTFDLVTRNATLASGRRALLALGGAGLVAALAGSAGADAKKKGKKARNKKKCNKQKNQCREGIEEYCLANSMTPQTCIDGLEPCCAQCNLEFAVLCTVEAVTSS